jgi:hypothetical protein
LLATAAAALFAAGALALALTLAGGPLLTLVAPLPRLAREARLAALTAIGIVVYFGALGLGLWLTGAIPTALLRRARRPLGRTR